MRDAQLLVLLGRKRGEIVQQTLERAEHQRERCAEFMAHVGEKDGLGAIDLRQRRGASALFLIGHRVGDGRGDLRSNQIEEAQIEGVETEPCAHTGHQHASELMGCGGTDWHHHRGPRLVRPGTGWNVHESLFEIFDDDGCFAVQNIGQAPRVPGRIPAGQIHRDRTEVRAHCDTSRTGKANLLPIWTK
jgi:hypothetical protein